MPAAMHHPLLWIVLAAIGLGPYCAAAMADGPAEAAGNAIVVKLVTDFETARPVSDLEDMQPVKSTVFRASSSQEITLGEKAVLWVRNAHIDRKFFFERYYQDKYVGRKAAISIATAELGPGQHTFEPGGHKFTLSPEGRLASDDPTLRVQGSTLLVRLFPVTVFAVDGTRSGPPEFRMKPADVGLLGLAPQATLQADALPDPKRLDEPRLPLLSGKDPPVLTNLLSDQRAFYPLTVWLPANQQGQGYVLYPSWQAFHLRPDGTVELGAGGAPRVAGVEAQQDRIVIPYHRWSGRLNTQSKLTAGVGAVPLAANMDFGATLAAVPFRAGYKDTPHEFFLPVDCDPGRTPNKFFVADNTAADKDSIRLMALEWPRPVFSSGGAIAVSLRLLEAPGKPSLEKPEARVSWSRYNPSNPLERFWQPLSVLGWTNGRERGELRFRVPEIPLAFVVFHVEVVDAAAPDQLSPLWGEIEGCVVQPGQSGTAAFITNKGRNAFVAGEDIDLTLVFRSREPHPAATRRVTITHPDGHQESLAVEDAGGRWSSRSLRLPAERTLRLGPGRYVLSAADLPAGMVSFDFAFDLVPRQKPSLFHIIKTSKYTKPMNDLEPSHLLGKPIDLDRTVRTLAELGFNRIDLMSYMTHHHLRAYTWREELAAQDDCLPPPESVFTPSPRDQILNACVRHQVEYSDVWLSYGDFHLPRKIEPYIAASERWMAREIQAMRHSPALDGMMLYDEMYQQPAVGIVKHHPALFAKLRAAAVEKDLGATPGKIEEAMSRYLARPPSQRDPKALELYLKYQDWLQHSWADYVNRVVRVGRELAPTARFGTYYRTWGTPGDNDVPMHGYPPDLFANLDIIGHVHYADNATCWVSTPMMAQILRTGRDKLLYLNMPLVHEARTQWDGQYQRHMAFAVLAQGANGVAQWGTPHTFDDGPNPGTAQAYETTGPMNRAILAPFGEIIDRTRNGYHKVGIVSTMNQHALAAHKSIPTSNQTEGLWIACWRLGYPAVFVREEHCGEPLEGFSVLFVPGIRYENELDDNVVRRLRAAIAAGVKVVVEADSTLDLPGIVKLKDWNLNTYYLGGNYFPTWLDDELNKVYEKSQPIVDYLGPKFREWGVEPAARGPFKVGPSWRDGGQAQYLVMANFDDPDYRHAVRQQMARPVLMPLTIPPGRGTVAYDLLAQQEIELRPAEGGQQSLTLDMRRIQGAMVALLPQRVGKLAVRHAVSADANRLRLEATLVGVSGKPLDAVFPVRIQLGSGSQQQTFYRVLGRELAVEFDLPQAQAAATFHVEVREALSGCTVSLDVAGGVLHGPSLTAQAENAPEVPRPQEVQAFLGRIKKVVIVPAREIAGVEEQARTLAGQLQARGIEARVADEAGVYHFPAGDPQSEDPLGDGFHSWHSTQEAIAPALVVDEPVILMAGRHSSLLLDTLAEHGILSVAPIGGPGQSVRPTIQVAAKALHYAHDTLCLIANDAPAMELNVQWITAALSAQHGVASRQDSGKDTGETPVPPDGSKDLAGAERSAIVPATAFMGTNELVEDLQFDPAGNLYAITWGHGKNLYSLTPAGRPRFARHLPEMGTNRLNVYDDCLFAYTAAGARLYRLGLDNRPLAQAWMNMDPGPVNVCDSYDLSEIDFRYLPHAHRLLHNLGDRMRVLDEQFNILAQWQGEPYHDKDVSDETLHRTLHAYAVSPDGQRVAQLEASHYFTKWAYKDEAVYDVHVVIRDLDGKLLGEYKNVDNGKKVEAQLYWPADAPGPIVVAKERRWAFDAELKVVSIAPRQNVLFELGDDRVLLRDNRTLVYQDRFGHNQCRLGPLAVLPSYTGLSPDGRWIALLDEYARLSIYNTADGTRRAAFTVPERGRVLRFTPDGRQLVLGSFRGTILAYDLDGRLQWQSQLAGQNDVLGGKLPLYDPSFPDFSDKLWPVTRDAPDDLDRLVRLDPNRLTNGDMEQTGGWHAEQGEPVYRNEGYRSPRSLEVGPAMVGQEINDFLGQHATWVLEFFYRSAAVDKRAGLVAGMMTQSDYPDSVARRFEADGTWRFGRVVAKSGSHCQKLAVGFAAPDGAVLVDGARLRRIRFPSINHLQFEPFHAVQPAVLENHLFESRYNPFGAAKEQAPNKILLPNTANGCCPQIDAGFLQNGRINDVTSHWYVQPYSREGDLVISCGLKEPRWISMVGLYFNAYDAENILPHFDIVATDLEARQDQVVASVRNNGQLFRLVKFPPVKTSLVKLRLVNSIARLRTLTEIELYGPLSGHEGAPGFADPEGENTYMANFTRVDTRRKTLPALQPPLVVRQQQGGRELTQWFAPLAQVLAGEDGFHVARTFGQNSGYLLADPKTETYAVRTSSLGFTPYGTLYGGLLLRCGNDGTLYCFSPETGTLLWSTPLGERLFGCPVAVGEDVFLANDAKKLFQIDLASGGILKEVPLSGNVGGSLATDGRHLLLITDDGLLHDYRVADLVEAWHIPVAPWTDSTPATAGGVVYLADQKGTARAVAAADGKLLWQTELGDEFCRCPVVGPETIAFGCRGGTLAVLRRADGKLLWSKNAESRFDYEPLLLDDRLLFFRGSRGMLAAVADGREEPLVTVGRKRGAVPIRGRMTEPFDLEQDPVVSISYYKGNLFLIGRPGETWHQALLVNMPWHPDGGSFTLLQPVPPPVEKEKP
jgi:outer membrane protein assembly factor BamB